MIDFWAKAIFKMAFYNTFPTPKKYNSKSFQCYMCQRVLNDLHGLTENLVNTFQL